MGFTCSLAPVHWAVWAVHHGARRLQARWSASHCRWLHPWSPLGADFDRARLEHCIREVNADHPVNRRTEIQLQGFAAGRALDLYLIRRHSVSAWKGPVVELQHEVAAADLIRRNRACDVVPPELIRRRFEAGWRHHACARQALLALVL